MTTIKTPSRKQGSSIDGSNALVRHIHSDEPFFIPLIRLVNIEVKEKPQHTKREQIIDILKQGLSAADVADKILTLFN